MRGVALGLETASRPVRRSASRLLSPPLAPDTKARLRETRKDTNKAFSASAFVNPTISDYYKNSKWRISHGLELIFKAAHIETSVRIEGRRTRTPEATFHSLRHTFVSLAANAGVPLPVVQSIVGHSSTAMTRHYYHENEEMLRQAVAAIPSLDDLKGSKSGSKPSNSILQHPRSAQTVEQRLRQLEKLRRKSLISEEEYAASRNRILAEI
jgi:hypothetical protein